MNNVTDLLRAAATAAPSDLPVPDFVSEFTPAIPAPSLADSKRVEVSVAADEKRSVMGAIPNFRNAAISRQTGSGLATSEGVERDLATFSYDQIREKYGVEQGNDLIRQLISAQDSYQGQTTGWRTDENVASDAVSGVGLGLLNSFGGLGALGLGMINKDAGLWAAQQLQNANEAVQGTQSPALQGARAANADRTALDERDSTATFERERTTQGDFVAGLRRIGRDAMNTARNVVQDPALLSDTVAQAGGSLVAAGPLGRAIGGAADVASAAAARVAPGATSAVSRGLAAIGERLPGPVRVLAPDRTAAAIGAMEAGGAYTQTANEIAGMSEQQLAQGSAEYRALREQGMGHEEARAEIANRAALLSAGITAPAAVAAGKLVSRFEATPLRMGSIPQAAGNLIREAVEEGVQSGVGQVAQNASIQRLADEGRALSEGVGGQVALGVLGGSGSAAAIQAPGVAGRSALVSMRAAGQAAFDAVQGRADAVRARNEAASPVSPERVQAATEAAVAEAPQAQATILEGVAQAAETAGATPEQKSEAEAYATRLIGAVQFDPAQLDDPTVPEILRTTLSGSTNRFDAMKRLADVITSAKGDTPTTEVLQAGMALQMLSREFEDIAMSEPEILRSLPKDSDAVRMVHTYGGLLANMQQSAPIQRAFRQIKANLEALAEQQAQSKAGPIKPVTEDSLDTVGGQQNAQLAVGIAEVAPDKASLEINNQILTHARSGKIKLTQAQFGALMTSNAILQAMQRAKEAQDQLGHTRPISQVSDEIQTKAGIPERDSRQSALGHATRVFNAMRAGNQDLAAERLKEMGEFVEHLQNKVGALNAHFDKTGGQGGGQGVGYRALNPTNRRWYDSPEKLAVHPRNANSVELAQRIEIEAQRLADIYNGLSEAFPSLNGGRVQAVPLNLALQGKPAEVAKRFQAQASQNQGKKAQASTSKQAAQPKVVESSSSGSEPKAQPQAKTQAESQPETKAAAPSRAAPTRASVSESDTEAAAVTTTPTADASAPTQEEAPAKPVTIEEAYAKLASPHFRKAFRLPKKARSRITGVASPLTELMKQFSGKAMQDYREHLARGEMLAERLDDRLQATLKKPENKTSGRTLMEAFAAGRDITRFPDFRAMNIAERDEESGTLVYNRELVEGAVLAGLQWILTANQRTDRLDAKAVKALTGLEVTDDDEPAVRELDGIGLTSLSMKQGLASKIRSYWGLDENPSASMDFTKGIPEALAAELLEIFVEQDWLAVKTRTFPGSEKTIDFFRPTWTIEKDDPMAENLDFIEKAVLVEPEEVNFFGSDRPKVADKQLRNPLVENTPEQKAMIKAAQETPHFIHLPMVRLYQALGLENLSSLFAAGSLDGKAWNQEHKKSLEGQNRNIENAFRQLELLVSEASARAKQDGVEVDRLPIHYAYNVTRVGRLQMLGRYNPQSTKLVREAVLPTRSTLDLSRETSKPYASFMLGIAQAIGEKVHKQSFEKTEAETRKKLQGKLAPAVEILRGFHRTGKLQGDLVGALKQGLGGDLSVVALHALSEYARLLETSPEGRASFETGLYVEADGVTNGPVNATMLLSIGDFSEHWVKTMAKGGLFFRGGSNGPKTMNEQHAHHDSKDLYQGTTDVLSRLFRGMNATLKNDGVKAQLASLKDLMDLFLDDFRLVEDDTGNIDVEMKRGIAKNPLTITIYGSGEKGIASKVTGAMLENLYARMSQVAQRQAENPDMSIAEAMFGDTSTDLAAAEAKLERFAKAWGELTSKIVVREKKQLYVTQGMKTTPRTVFDPVSFKVDPGREANLKENVRHLFVTPLRQAITETVGEPVMAGAKLLQQATQIQSLFQEQAFNDAIRAVREAKKETDPEAGKSSLSQAEVNRVLREVMKRFPLVQTQGQSFFPAGSQSTEANNDTGYGRSLTGGFRTPGFVYGPTDAGVAGIPFMVIGSGDGMAIQSLATMQDAPEGALFIFDGVNFRLTTIEQDSQKANQAIFESWKGNPIAAVAAAYKASLPGFSLEGASDKLIEKLGRTLGIREPTPESVQRGMEVLARTLEDAALSVEARHKAIQRVTHHIDQMAAASSPYLNQGQELKGQTDAEIAAELQKLYEEELAKLQPKAKAAPAKKPEAISTPAPKPAEKSAPKVASKPSAPGSFTPKNEEQREGIEKIQAFLNAPASQGRVFVLEGKAGTGKTTIMQEALREVLAAGETVTIAAVSHKAKTVLNQKLLSFVKANKLRGKVSAHSVAGLFSMVLDRKTGKFVVDPDKLLTSPITKARVLVVDEASMIDQKTYDLIMKHLPAGTKVVFLGDIGQLAPVEGQGEISPIFTSNAPRHKLLERVRQGEDSSILPYADLYWNNSQTNEPRRNPAPPAQRKDTPELRFLSNLEDVFREYVGMFRQAVAAGDPSLVKIVAYNNKEGTARGAPALRDLEQRIRQALFGSSPRQFEKGELVILNDNFRMDDGSDEPVTLENSREFSVVSSFETQLKVRDETFPTVSVTIKAADGPDTFTVPVLSNAPGVRQRWQAMLDAWASEINRTPSGKREAWARFYETKESLAPLTYGYVITSHKAQGSTYGTSIVLEDNFLEASQESPANISRGIYTAITRASNQAVIVSRLNPSQEAQAPAREEVKLGVEHPTGVRILDVDSLSKLMDRLNLPPTMRAVYEQIQIAGAMKGWTVVHGTPDQLRAYDYGRGELGAVRLFADMQKRKGIQGATVFSNRTIYLVTPSKETLIHELIHAATFETLAAYYRNSASVSVEVKGAIDRLEELMRQFRDDFDRAIPGGTSKDYEDAITAIESALRQGRRDVALNEFMAWGLANRNLASTLERTEASSLVRIAKATVAAIKKLIFGDKPVPKTGDDMLSSLLFNTSIIVQAQSSLQERLSDTTLMMSRGFGSNQRLARIQEAFDRNVAQFLQENPVDRPVNETRVQLAASKASDLAMTAQSVGFATTPQEATTFQAIVTALAVGNVIDPTAMAAAQELYAHALKHLKVESFLLNDGRDEQADRYQAQQKFDMVVGKKGIARDEQGRSSLLPVFLALAMVDDGLRSVLAKLPMPKTALNKEGTLDATLENAGNQALDLLSRHLAGLTSAKNVQQGLDALSSKIQEIAHARTTLADQLGSQAGGLIDRANQIFVDGVQALADRAVNAAEKLDAKTQNRFTAALASSVRVAAAIASETQAEKVARGVTAAMNNIDGFRPFRETVNDIIGRTESNKGVYDLIKLVRSMVQQDRQQFREHLPTKIAEQFKTKLSDAQWSMLFRGMAKTDLAALAGHFTRDEILEMLGESGAVRVGEVIQTLEAYIQREDPQHWNLIQKKAKQLAFFMNTGRPGTNLLRNAEAITRLLGERTQKGRQTPGRNFVDGVDQLVTLYALQGLSKADREGMSSLVRGEAEGMGFTLAYLVGQRVDEMQKARRYGRARLNHYKGYVPSTNQDGVSLVVARDAEAASLLEKSYVRVGDYGGSSAESFRGSMGYYFAPVSARSPFNQGIIQNVRMTASGVEASSGFTDGLTAGRIADPETVKRISQGLRQEQGDVENLMPVFDELGSVVAYERSVDPVQLQRLERDTHLARMIGVWRGRQVEEAKAKVFNERLIDALYEMRKKDLRENPASKSEYVNLLDEKTWRDDPVLVDAMSLISSDTWQDAQAVFGRGEFWVRRDMLNDALGYRSASIGDAWTGVTRWPSGMRDQVKSLALAFMGNDAYRWLMNAETALQGLVKDVRVLIVVKSVVVPAANFVSNLVHLVSRGVPIRSLVKGVPAKIAEINAYTRGRLREIDLEADLRSAEAAQDLVKARKLKVELQTVRDGYRRMTIWPLIEAGEFSSISDAGISRDDLLLSQGRLHAYMERLADRLPGPFRTAGRYGLITKDTALFQGLQKAVEYGDFIAKAMIYDDLTKRQKKSKAYALGRVTEEFVNYDRLPGRFRGTMENLGLLWFYNFKIRSAKVALSVIRNNPVHALLGNLLPTPPGIGPVGTALEDNLFTKGLEGTLGYSIGPGMALRAPGLNPWASLAF